MDLARINRMADRDISGYDGDAFAGSYDGQQYTGFKDDFVDFGGTALDFATSIAAARMFNVTISNTTGSNYNVVLCPSYAPDLTTVSNTVVVADGTIGGVSGLTGLGYPTTIGNFLAWLNINPTRVIALRVSSTVSVQMAQTITITRKSPFKQLENEYINIQSFQSEANNNDKLVTVQRPFQMDNQTQVSCIVPAGAVTTFSFFCGAVLNVAAALNKKHAKAAQTAAKQS